MTSAGSTEPLLTEDDPPPFELANETAPAPILLTCDHASPRIPRRLGDLGLAAPDLARHIAWDIGAADVTRHMARQLDAPAILAGFSRLVVDCNRHLHDPTLMPAVSDGMSIAANANIAPHERQARIDEIYQPYHG
ncbi:MAG: N-formylglutamate amidohydrolase, partial [Dongiaceae bacterium]